MKAQTSRDNISSLDRALGVTLAAFSMFVFGYTVTRTFLSQPSTSNLTNSDRNLVIPHQASLWSDFGN